ncbi:MAG: hypothetical protein NPIRA04_07700 [Nitrospirales bacterium]|nr:MAG: hypothetical protein NPIRA04_07700 [Nitrospirales bacterium]
MRLTLIALVLVLSIFSNAIARDIEREMAQRSFENVASVDEGVDFIRTTLENQGFEIVATIDHQAGARSVDLELRPTQVILFRQARLDSALIRRTPLAALDLPHKFLVFEDEHGDIQLRVNLPGFLIDRHDVPVFDGFVAKLDRALTQFGRLDNGVRLVKSHQSVDQTVETLLQILKERGFRIPAVVKFLKHAHRFSGNLRKPQLIIFGNPQVGTPLMQNNQSIGLDLPQKFLVFQDRKRQVYIAFNDPQFLAQKHHLQRDRDPGDLDVRLTNITNALLGLAEAGAQP